MSKRNADNELDRELRGDRDEADAEFWEGYDAGHEEGAEIGYCYGYKDAIRHVLTNPDTAIGDYLADQATGWLKNRKR